VSCGIPDPTKSLTVTVVQSKLDVKIQACFYYFIYKRKLMQAQWWILDSYVSYCCKMSHGNIG
jgi:hypothetical protein